MTCKITAGNIYKIPFSFTDLTETKIRPALAIADSDAYGDAEFFLLHNTSGSIGGVLGSDPTIFY